MEQKVKEATEWFREVDDSPEVYMISSKHKDSQEQFGRTGAHQLGGSAGGGENQQPELPGHARAAA